MSRVTVGIPLRAQPRLLAQTLENLRVTAPGARVVLIPDAPDVEMSDYLERCCDVEQLASSELTGGAACFNRLAGSGDAEVYVLLENGSLGAAGWLDRLLETFRRVPRCGITGPSTNHGGNEQNVVGANARVDRTAVARALERRYGVGYRSLGPTHTLAEFCYAVRQEVIESIGVADIAYDAGPGWALDYNIRAHRAGLLGLWTCGAYVHRAGTAEGEALLSQRGAERFQDKFCGLRLRGVRAEYRPHCRGEACVNFAPALISLKIDGAILTADTGKEAARTAAATASDELPLVSCIMPTCDRRTFVPGAVLCFLAQGYSRLELVVVDDGTDCVRDLLPADPRIRYVRLEKKLSTGTKRNVACEHSCGTLIAHWDDDDWHAPDRIQKQVEAMRAGNFQVGGTTTLYYREEHGLKGFRYAYGSPGKAWMGAMIYKRTTWERHRFEDLAVGEDSRFIARVAVAERLDMQDLSLTVCSIHSSNTSLKVTSGAFWKPERMETIDAMIRGRGSRCSEGWAMISCIMPTHNRRAFMALALQGFLAQTHANKELVVVDDGSDGMGDLVEGMAGIQYIRVKQRMTIGAKRNLACEAAQGELIAHWDDDDWYGPGRLEYQALPLHEGRCDLNGLTLTRVLEMPQGVFWSISRALHQKMFVGDVHGGTIMFTKALWREGVRYPQANLAEDAALIRQATQRRKRLLRLENAEMFVYLRHACNTWKFNAGQFVDAQGWQTTEAPANFPMETLERYREACAATLA